MTQSSKAVKRCSSSRDLLFVPYLHLKRYITSRRKNGLVSRFFLCVETFHAMRIWSVDSTRILLLLVVAGTVVDPDPQGSETFGQIRNHCSDPGPGQVKARTIPKLTLQM